MQVFLQAEKGGEMMKGNRDYKKLFSRDRIFLLCLTGAVALVLLYGLAGCYQMIEIQKFYMDEIALTWEEYSRKFDLVLGLWGTTDVDIAFCRIFQVVCWIVMAAQIGKWHLLEGRHGREFQKLLPVKSSSHLTYDFICGIIFVWLPFIFSWLLLDGWLKALDDYADLSLWVYARMNVLLIVYTFIYVLLVFSKRITNNIPGTLLSAFVIGLGFLWIEESNEFFSIGEWIPESPGTLMIILLTAVGVIMAYWCDKKKDIAGNGTFVFQIAHYVIIGLLFLELADIFLFVMVDMDGGFIGNVAGVLLSGAVAFGVHYIAKPKNL